jgi:hypothetical protein
MNSLPLNQLWRIIAIRSFVVAEVETECSQGVFLVGPEFRVKPETEFLRLGLRDRAEALFETSVKVSENCFVGFIINFEII